jgi:glycyl-tRNA synthetase beta chain
MLFGSASVDAESLGIRASKHSRGHRFHAPQQLSIASPAKYVATLREKGYVMADVSERREVIRNGVISAAQAVNGEPVIEPALLDEVTALIEWPVPVTGSFDARFLDLPAEVPIATMQDHQRYFPMRRES